VHGFATDRGGDHDGLSATAADDQEGPVVSRTDVQQSDALDHGVRLGLAAYGLVHLLVAYTAVRVAFGDQAKANQQGALDTLARSPGGQLGLWVVALGFFVLLLWQAFEAVLGHQREDGAKKAGKRVVSAGKAVVYLALGVTAVKKAAGSSSSSSGTDSTTARLMSAPGGQVLVGIVGLVILGIAGFLVWKGLTERFTKDLDSEATLKSRRTAIVWLGKIGYAAKGVALGVVGILFLTAAVKFQPKRSGGLDQALKTLLDQPFGPFLLLAVALGLGCFGLYCLAWARHLDR
jgi:hypothetical protein